NEIADSSGQEITVKEVYEAFIAEYIARETPLQVRDFHARRETDNGKTVNCTAEITLDGKEKTLQGRGNGPIAAFVDSLTREKIPPFEIQSYFEHSLGKGTDSRAVSYIEIKTAEGETAYGAGIDTNI